MFTVALFACRSSYQQLELADNVYVSYPASWETNMLEDGSTLFRPQDEFYHNTTIIVAIEPAIGSTLFEQLNYPLQTHYNASLSSLDALTQDWEFATDVYKYETEIVLRADGRDILLDTEVYLRIVGENLILAQSILETSNDRIQRQHQAILRSAFSQ